MYPQRSRIMLAVATVLVCLAPMTGQAITPYSQDFEFLIQSDPAALSGDGWVVYGNVYNPDGSWIYGYGTFPAPNDGYAFCQIDLFQGGDEQGFQQLSIFNDYNSLEHLTDNQIESNTFQEQIVEATDVGQVFKFYFDAKMGNLEGSSTALAFIKTIDPTNNWAMTNFVSVDMTATPETWMGYSLSLLVDAGLVGQYVQFGFSNTAIHYEGSGVFYDNLVFVLEDASAVPGSADLAGAVLGQNYPNPFNPTTRIDFSLEKAGSVDITVFDVAGRKVANLHQGNLDAGDHNVTWNGMSDAGTPVASGRYNYVLQTAAGQTARSMILLK